MSELDKVWEAIDGLRALLTRIDTLLQERCNNRGARIESLETKINELEVKYHVLDKTVLKWTVISGLITAVFTSAVTGLIMFFIQQAAR